MFSSWLGAIFASRCAWAVSHIPSPLCAAAAVLVKGRHNALHEQGLKGLGGALELLKQESLLLLSSPRAMCPSLFPRCTGSLGDYLKAGGFLHVSRLPRLSTDTAPHLYLQHPLSAPVFSQQRVHVLNTRRGWEEKGRLSWCTQHPTCSKGIGRRIVVKLVIFIHNSDSTNYFRTPQSYHLFCL